MRKINSIVTSCIIILFLVHAITGIFKLTSIMPGGQAALSVLSWVMVGLVAVHVIISCILTGQTFKTLKAAGKSYFKENQLFWIRRISGLALMLFMIYHVFVFSAKSGEVFRLNTFGGVQLAGSILLLITLLIHICCNIRPLLTALGIAGRKYVRDAIVIISIILLVCAAAFIIYFLRWNILWQYH